MTDYSKIEREIERLDETGVLYSAALEDSQKHMGKIHAAAKSMRLMLEVVKAANGLAIVQRTRVWEDADYNSCGMDAGDATDVHQLRALEQALAASKEHLNEETNNS